MDAAKIIGSLNPAVCQFTLDTIFTATVNYGDSHINFPAALTGGDLVQGNWTIQGTPTYAHTGLYKITADVFS